MNNEKEQTALGWYSRERDIIEIQVRLGVISSTEYSEKLIKIKQEAKEMEKEQMIDFASWLSKSEWMSIWVVDKWMWECQKENSNTNYKTDKELFDIYYNETYGGN
jgi:hypothetical protein